MRRLVTSAFAGLVLLATPAHAFVVSPAGLADETAPRVDVMSRDMHGMTVEFELPELVTGFATLEGKEFQILAIPGGEESGEAGAPAIPTYARLVPVPPGATAEVTVTTLEERELDGVHLIPMQSGDSGRFEYNARAYQARPAADTPAAMVGAPGRFRDFDVVPLTFRPVRYDPVSGTARVASRMRVEVRYHGGSASLDAAMPRTVPPSFDAMYRELLIGYPEIAGNPAVLPGTLLIICANNQAEVDSLARLVTWHTRVGIPTRLVTTAQTGGASADSIKAYIFRLYNTPGVNLENVCIAGDVSGTYGMPTWYESWSGYNGEGDLPYVQQGTDMLPVANVGRLSFEDLSTLSHEMSKIINYESTPDMTDTSWFLRSTVVGDPSESGPSCVQTGRWLVEQLAQIGYAETDSIFSSSSWPTSIKTALSRGDSQFGYRGYYQMSGFSVANVAQLTNGWKLPFAGIITCDTGSFAQGTSRTEAFLRAWNSTPPSGAIGAIGMSTTGTHTRPNNCLYYGLWRGLFDSGTMGAARSRLCLELYLNYWDSDPTEARWFAHWANLMGDPAVRVWTAVPRVISVTAPASIARGTNSVTVSVNSGATPIEGAQVCLWKGSETYAVALTGASGSVELAVATPTVGSMLVTVSGENLRPYQASIPVTQAASSVGYLSSSVDDDNTGGSSGNGDGWVNPGETIQFKVRLQNFGSTSAPAVTATLSAADPWTTVLTSTQSYGDIPAGGTAWSAGDYLFTVRNDCPDAHAIPFSLDITSGSFHGHALVQVPVVSASLVAQEPRILGDPNGILDPGENRDLVVKLHNTGGAGATAVTGLLQSLSPEVSVTDASGAFGTIPVDSIRDNNADHFAVSADAGTYKGYLANFRLITTFSGGATDTTAFSLTVGTRASTDPVGPDKHGYLAYDNTDVSYPDAPAYQWIELDPAYGGNGVEVTLGDTGLGLDKLKLLSLPFSFEYYGQSFTQATVSSNGVLSFGTTIVAEFFNGPIPGPAGPDAMVAPFWDDLYQNSGSKAYQRYDASGHRWIMEWSHFLNAYSDAVETFEVVLYDPAFYPTDTGDGLILFQYQTVTNNDAVDAYATTGIESPDQHDGLLYTFNGVYPAGAATLAAGRAIRFVPVLEGPVGTLEGIITNASAGGRPVAGVTVRVLGTSRAFASGADGHYLGSVPPGTYTLVTSHPSFAPDTTAGVVITEQHTTTVNFALTDIAGPIITTTQFPSTADTLGPYPIPVHIVEFSGLAEKTLYWCTSTGPLTPAALTPQGNDDYLALIPGQPLGTTVSYYVHATDSLGFASTDPPGAPGAAYSFAVVAMQTVLADDFESDHGWTVGAPDDNATTGIWIRADPVGTQYGGYQIQPEDDHTPDPGVQCFVTGNGTPGGDAGVNDVDGGKTTLFSPVFDLSHYAGATVRYWLWYSNNRGNTTDDSWLVQVTSDGTNWVDLENTTASTAESWVQRTFDLGSTIPLTSHVQLRFVASDYGGGSLVEAAVDDFQLTGMPRPATAVPGAPAQLVLRTEMDPCRPNPFASETRIEYRVKDAGAVRLGIYDVSGRLIRNLVDGGRSAGEYTARWDGRNAAGLAVSPGIYFLRFEAPGRTQVRSMTLLR